MAKPNREYFGCECQTFDHIFGLDVEPYDEKYGGGYLYIFTSLINHNSFWQRLKIAFRYVFRLDYQRYPFTEIIIQDDKELARLKDYIESVVQYRNEMRG